MWELIRRRRPISGRKVVGQEHKSNVPEPTISPRDGWGICFSASSLPTLAGLLHQCHRHLCYFRVRTWIGPVPSNLQPATLGILLKSLPHVLTWWQKQNERETVSCNQQAALTVQCSRKDTACTRDSQVCLRRDIIISLSTAFLPLLLMDALCRSQSLFDSALRSLFGLSIKTRHFKPSGENTQGTAKTWPKTSLGSYMCWQCAKNNVLVSLFGDMHRLKEYMFIVES